MNTNLSHQEVVEILKTIGCEPLDTYKSKLTPMRFRCFKHNIIYIDKFTKVRNNPSLCNRCPECLKELNKDRKITRLTNELIDIRVKTIHSGHIIRLGNVNGRHTKIEWKCLICNNIWTQTPGNVCHETSPCGCRKCNKANPDTLETFNEKLRNLGREDIVLISEYKNSTTKANFKCNRCGLIWQSKPANILNLGRGCPCCSYKSEKLVGDLLQKILAYTPKHNQYIKTEHRKFLIDWYIKDLNLAVEYHGIQHFRPVKFGSMTLEQAEENFINQKIRDNDLRIWCSNNNVNLIEIDGRYNSFKNPDKLYQKLINTLREKNISCINS